MEKVTRKRTKAAGGDPVPKPAPKRARSSKQPREVDTGDDTGNGAERGRPRARRSEPALNPRLRLSLSQGQKLKLRRNQSQRLPQRKGLPSQLRVPRRPLRRPNRMPRRSDGSELSRPMMSCVMKTFLALCCQSLGSASASRHLILPNKDHQWEQCCTVRASTLPSPSTSASGRIHVETCLWGTQLCNVYAS